MTTPDKHPAQRIVDLGFGFILSGALATAAELRVADHLESGPKHAAALAEELGAHALSLYRVLRLLASVGVSAETRKGAFASRPRPTCCAQARPGRCAMRSSCSPRRSSERRRASSPPPLKSGSTGFDRIFGAPFFDYLSRDPAAGEVFHRGMAGLSDLENALIAQSYDFSPFERVVDVGGGHGGFLIEVLKAAPKVLSVTEAVAA